PIQLRAALRNHHVVIRSAKASDGLREQNWLRGDIHIGFSGVVLKVQADGDELPYAVDRTADPGGAGNGGQGFGVQRRKGGEDVVGQNLRPNVGHLVREVSDDSLGVQ